MHLLKWLYPGMKFKRWLLLFSAGVMLVSLGLALVFNYKYLDYIEESTNVVKSKVKLSKLILILSYLVIWAFNIMVSWFFSAESISEAQAGAFQWLVLPVATIVISLLIGKNDFWGKRKWFAPIGFGLMFLLSIYASYGMRENSIFNQIDLQTITLFFIGAIASVIGIVLGYAFFTVEKNTPKSE